MQITCPNCDTPIPARNINIEKTLAVCPSCDNVFNFGDDIAPRKPKIRKVKMPDEFTAEDTPDGGIITFPASPRKRRRGMLILIVLFSVLYIAAMAAFATMVRDGLWLSVFFTVPMLPLVYAGIAHTLNRREVVVDAMQLLRRQRPLSVGSPVRYDGENIVSVRPVRNLMAAAQSGAIAYDVRLRLRDAGDVTFIGALPEAHALFLAQELNRMLFEDAPPAEVEDALLADDEVDDAAALLDDRAAARARRA